MVQPSYGMSLRSHGPINSAVRWVPCHPCRSLGVPYVGSPQSQLSSTPLPLCVRLCCVHCRVCRVAIVHVQLLLCSQSYRDGRGRVAYYCGTRGDVSMVHGVKGARNPPGQRTSSVETAASTPAHKDRDRCVADLDRGETVFSHTAQSADLNERRLLFSPHPLCLIWVTSLPRDKEECASNAMVILGRATTVDFSVPMWKYRDHVPLKTKINATRESVSNFPTLIERWVVSLSTPSDGPRLTKSWKICSALRGLVFAPRRDLYVGQRT